MPLRKADGPLTVHVPSPREDRPSLIGVGVIAVAGFVVGVAWPRLAGVRIGPSVPDTSQSAAAEPVASTSGSPSPTGVRSSAPSVGAAVPAALSAPATAAASPMVSATTGTATAGGASHVGVARGAIFSCKGADGEVHKGTDCGALPGLDALVQPRLRRLVDCPEAASTSGKLHLVVRADFARDALTVDLARDHGVSTAEPLLVCAKSVLASASLDGIAHENARYSIAYTVSFGAAPASDAPASANASPAPGNAAASPQGSAPSAAPPSDGTAQVEWEVAIVRDAPKTGKVLARLQRGTTIHVGTSKDGWYPVKYGDGFGSDGWIYRGAIGR